MHYFICAEARKGRLIDEEEAESYGWLEEIEMPDEAVMYGVHYMGPEIIESAP